MARHYPYHHRQHVGSHASHPHRGARPCPFPDGSPIMSFEGCGRFGNLLGLYVTILAAHAGSHFKPALKSVSENQLLFGLSQLFASAEEELLQELFQGRSCTGHSQCVRWQNEACNYHSSKTCHRERGSARIRRSKQRSHAN